MASPESCVLPADVPLPEDMDLQTSDDLTASVTSPTSTNNSAADTMPSRVLLLPDTNPFAPLRELEEQNSIEGKSENTFHQARIISTAPNGEKRARGSLIPTPERQHTSIPRDHSHMRSARHTLLASASYQNEEDGWIPVSYRRKQQNHAAVAVTPSSGAPRAYQHTVILRPKQPCRIMDEQFIRLDRVITRRISAHLNIPEEDPLPEFRVRYLGYSNQLAVDAAEPEVCNALLAIASLPIGGKEVPFQAYEAVNRDQIRGIIRNAGDMTSEELMNSLHCRKCKILQARPLGDKGTAMVTFEGNSLPYKVGLRSFTIRVFPYRARVTVCDICHKIGHRKEQCPNISAARCSTCGLRQHEEGTQCPNTEQKCRSCGGSHLATATNCPKRREVKKKIEQKRKPAAKRQRKQVNTQEQQRRPSATQGLQRPMLKPTRQGFYTGPPAPPAAQSEGAGGTTFADVVRPANVPLTASSNGIPHPSNSTLGSCAPQPASGGGTKHPRRGVAQSTGLPLTSDHSRPPAPTTFQELERRLEHRMAQIEKSIHERVEQLITRAIEKCVQTTMERIMLSGMLPLGTTSTTTAGALVMRTPLVPSNSIAPHATKPYHG
ncbi:hypothetical protein HPB51_005788 [Rhipicephalus microplus]|uniref:Uncharacterized protein n=2 Tax=Rhipicephalus microplus TaxID=6941 RepID=A0A9J6E4A5_RHIMP|nr:hypothetical protein HPB51_000180 [Rhipicephalus microplus]KAH8032894.1 hypothetical protein HPB51_003470 [Rhipicephalus microplus]KAH8035506.1 hypothetical protein HPB51_005788 [Rhipicephalus microplus]